MDKEIELIRKFHEIIPLTGIPRNAILSIPDDHLKYLICLIRGIPTVPPSLNPEEWKCFLSLIRSQRLLPYIAKQLQSWPNECKPPMEVISELNQFFMIGAVRSLLTGRQIQTVVSALENAGIEVLLLKGPALARTVYPDPATRLSGDIDLLVKPEELYKCGKIFSDLGYSCTFNPNLISLSEYNNLDFFPRGKGLKVELHWTIDWGYNIFSEDWFNELFKRKIPIKSDDLSCFTLYPQDHLFYLSFHDIFQHQSLQLDWIIDIALLMQFLKDRDAWEYMRSTSKKFHIRKSIELALTVGNLWLGYDIPYDYGDFSTWSKQTPYEDKLWRYAPTRDYSLRSYFCLNLIKNPGIIGKTLYLIRFFFPPISQIDEYRRSGSFVDIPKAYVRRWKKVFSMPRPNK